MTAIILIVKSGLSRSTRRAPEVVNQVAGGFPSVIGRRPVTTVVVTFAPTR
jgi:hypothetical protein